ncbi:MAG: class I SAM-dependent methyltransferase [Chloroflexi bacterium]|nr:MAG: class I SAM-dependent methyltransferase [Chloroflexota bacterium]
MTEAASEREKSIRRVRRFYEISAQREWERLEHPTQGALEFAINKAWIKKFLPGSGSRILDIGGGPGRYSIWLAAQGYCVTLGDLSPDLLAIAREKTDEQEVELEQLVEANAVDLSIFTDNSFDAVLCLGPMYHLLEESDRQAVAGELIRVLKPGGHAFVAFLNHLQALRAAVNQDIPFFTPYTFDIVKRWHYDHVMDFPVAGIFSPAWVVHPRDVPPLMERRGFRTVELVSSQSLAGDVQAHLALFAERQPELYKWVLDELVELANDPTIIGSAWHLLYIGEKP